MKRTNTGTYLHKQAYSPQNYKTSAIRALIYRAFRICSSNDRFETAYKKIRNTFINNGYHYKVIDKIKHNIIEKHSQNIAQTTMETAAAANDDIKTMYWKLPYMRQREKQTNTVVKTINSIVGHCIKVAVAYNTRKTSSFFRNKDKMGKSLQSNVVYKYTCDRCVGQRIYVGETRHHLSTRSKEHIRGQPSSEVSIHEHVATEADFSIALRTPHTTIGEALVYNSIPPSQRLNNNRPPFQLKIFEDEIST